MKCQQCDHIARIRITEKGKDGTIIEIHICDACAKAAGYPPGERDLFKRFRNVLKKTEKLLRELGD